MWVNENSVQQRSYQIPSLSCRMGCGYTRLVLSFFILCENYEDFKKHVYSLPDSASIYLEIVCLFNITTHDEISQPGLPTPFLHTTRDQKLELGKAWEVHMHVVGWISPTSSHVSRMSLSVWLWLRPLQINTALHGPNQPINSLKYLRNKKLHSWSCT